MNTDEIKDKKALRIYMKKLRRENADGGEKAVENFLSLPEIKQKKSFFLYNAFGTELPTMPLISALLAAGKEVCLPRMENGDMVAVRYTEGTPMSENSYGIYEPSGEAFGGVPDVTVLPLLAVDTAGNRLGYGGGYYDRYLQNKNTLKVAYCYDFQVTDEVFPEPHDRNADIIVTDKRVFRLRQDGFDGTVFII